MGRGYIIVLLCCAFVEIVQIRLNHVIPFLQFVDIISIEHWVLVGEFHELCLEVQRTFVFGLQVVADLSHLLDVGQVIVFVGESILHDAQFAGQLGPFERVDHFLELAYLLFYAPGC